LGDALSSVIISSNDLILEPGSYLVISKDSTVSDYYPFNISFIKISLPALNNTGDAVVIKDSAGFIIDSLYYYPDWGGGGNRSLERISSESPSINPSNWGTSINPYRATPGFPNSLKLKTYDAALSLFYIKEKYGITGEEVNFEICIKNTGTSDLSDITLHIYHDLNADSAAAQTEIIKSYNINHLPAADSIIYSFSYNNYSPGRNYFIAEVLNEDEDIYNNTAFCSFTGIERNIYRNDIVINEIMYAPDGEPEWIEIYNRSGKEVDLMNFRIADKTDTLFLAKSSCIFPPNEYMVISSDSSVAINRNIPSAFLKSSLPSLNNTGDRLMILDSLFNIVDSLEYTPSWGGRNGFSLEKVSPDAVSQDSLNWKTSTNKYRGTPGYINSVSQKEYDAAVAEIVFRPEYPVKGDTVNVSVQIKNHGSKVSDIEFILYNNEEAVYSSLFSITGKDSFMVNDCLTIFNLNNQQNLNAEVILPGDQDTTNNYLSGVTYPGYKTGSIVINEVHFSPAHGEQEWIELYNRSADTIPLKNWQISDVLSSPSVSLIKTDYLFLPGKFLIISADSSLKNYHRFINSDLLICSLPSLNNDADGVVISDERGLTIDSMFYKNITQGKSCERISADISSVLIQNWGSSEDIESSTPGRINSITPKDFDLSAGGLYFNPQYPVLNDTVFISASVRNTGLYNAENFIYTFYYGTPTDTILFTGTVASIPAGDTILISSAVGLTLTHPTTAAFLIGFDSDADPLNNYIEKKLIPGEQEGSVVINEIMYDPDDGYSEWVEILNISPDPINLKNWSISDLVPAPYKSFLTSEDKWIYPGDYYVISTDTTVLQLYPEIKNLITAKFGSLSSVNDGVILYDYRDAVIDVLKYTSKWGGRKGRSLERKSAYFSSADSSNWTTSLSPFKATPGKENSVTGLPDIPRSSVIINEIMYDPSPDNCEFIEIYNRTPDPINIGGWRLQSGNNNYFSISDTTRNLLQGNYMIFSADSSVINKYDFIDQNTISCASTASLGFSNTGTVLLLKDINGNTIDSVCYSPKLHNRNFVVTKNRSLERINPDLSSTIPENWTTSTAAAGATPAEVNSVYTGLNNRISVISVEPNPFSPDNDGWEDFAIINYHLNITAPQLRILIFDSTGRLVRTLADNLASGSDGSVIFDGRDDQGRTLRMGIYILYVEAAGSSGTEAYKSAFVIARRL
jgi:hypothetical protein